jgi:hypothetical protein
MSTSMSTHLKPTGAIGAWVVSLLCLWVVIAVSEALAFAHRIDLMKQLQHGGLITDDTATTADSAVVLATSLDLIVFIVTAVMWCVWQHRAHTNAIQLSGGGLRFTPGWAVGWWFIPVANLWKPFQAVRELWAASHAADRWRTVGTWPLIDWWWTLWIANVLVAWAAVGFGISSETPTAGPITPEDVINGDTWQIVSNALGIVVAFFAIKIVRTIVHLQDAQPRRAPGLGEQDTPPMPPPPQEDHDATAVT